jgi:hypothetical protein
MSCLAPNDLAAERPRPNLLPRTKRARRRILPTLESDRFLR